ncbi:Mitochondrial pyruvate carrier 2 [Psilocybe cubensis]|uniref:Mitochondrial pyruvate carrier n=2 Tax=Psilocybe cubensis TaxID=181762 RepID=A0A8H7Y236_PSICU|nr:Mitochondrial pyruvate carrier 2 [Psilocybe cubensis]KAH9481043.1 Mitochondrial pyruvate carrier 2 [Psilocybe cubensis]
MGGFVLADSNGRVEVITDEHFYDLLDKGSISFPDVSKDQICSLSRGDGLSKLIVVGQTSWFIAQCISRAIMSVGLTGLELVTLAFAFLNGLMYFLWWDKPLDAEYRIRIYPCSRPAPVPLPAWIDPLSPTTQILSHGQPEAGGSAAVNSNLQNTTLTQPRQDATKSSFYVHSGHVSPGAKDHITQDRVSRLREAFLFGWKRLSQMRGSHYTLDSPVTEIPTFYALPHRITAIPACNMAIAVIGVMFGAIHCAGWNLGFPTQEEKVLWRVCAVVVSTLPVLMVFHATLLMIGGIPTFLSGARHKGFLLPLTLRPPSSRTITVSLTMSGPAAASGASKVSAFINHPAGPKTVFFWAPFMKWGLVAAGLKDMNRPADKLSVSQNLALAATGFIWVRWSLVITPVNYNLAAVNFFVGLSGITQLGRIVNYRMNNPEPTNSTPSTPSNS